VPTPDPEIDVAILLRQLLRREAAEALMRAGAAAKGERR